MVEKPFGHDLDSARALAERPPQIPGRSPSCTASTTSWASSGVEEVLYLRFANAILEPGADPNYVSSVQITMAESFGELVGYRIEL